MVLRFTGCAVSNALLCALTSPMVPHSTGATDVDFFGDDALRGDMVPALTFEASYWFFLALCNGDPLVADCQPIYYCPIGCICI